MTMRLNKLTQRVTSSCLYASLISILLGKVRGRYCKHIQYLTCHSRYALSINCRLSNTKMTKLVKYSNKALEGIYFSIFYFYISLISDINQLSFQWLNCTTAIYFIFTRKGLKTTGSHSKHKRKLTWIMLLTTRVLCQISSSLT